MAKDQKQKFRDGGIKSVVLAAGALFVTGAAEAYRTGAVMEAVGLSLAAIAAYAIHEALTQYQFEFTEDTKEKVAELVPGLETQDREPPDSGA